MDNDERKPVSEASEPQHPPSFPWLPDMGKPGDAHCGRGVNEALDVIAALEGHGIPCCVVGTKALVYYGARRVPMVSP